MAKKKSIPNEIWFDKRVNRFRGNNGKYVSRKKLEFDFETERFKYNGRYVKVKGLKYDKKTGWFRNELGRFEKIKTKGEPPREKKARTISYDITDMFEVSIVQLLTPEEELVSVYYEIECKDLEGLINYMERLLTKGSKFTTRRAVYLYCELTIGEYDVSFASIMAQDYSDMVEDVIDDFIEKFNKYANGLLNSKNLYNNIGQMRYKIYLVYKDWF